MTEHTSGHAHQGDDEQPLDLTAFMDADELDRLAADARAAVRGTPAGYADMTTGTVSYYPQHTHPAGTLGDEGLVIEQLDQDPGAGAPAPVKVPRPRTAWQDWVPELLISAEARLARRRAIEHAAAHHTRRSHLYLGRLFKAGWYGIRYGTGNLVGHFTAADSYADDIAKAKAAKARKIGEASGNDWVRALKAEKRAEGKARRHETLPVLGAAGATSYVAALLAVAQVWGLIMAGVILLPAMAALMAYGQREHARRHSDLTPVVHFEPATLAADAPLGKDSFESALKRMGLIKETSEIHLVGLPRAVAISAVEMTVELPDECSLAALVAKKDKLAQAFRIRPEWLDIRDGEHSAQVVVWMASANPFGTPFVSPLVDEPVRQDAWGKGILIGFNRRGEPVYLKLAHVMVLLGGASRTGKGMLLRNLICGLGLDPRVNIRLAAGAKPGEHMGYSSVCATFFGRNPRRLVALLDALLAEAYRREDVLARQRRAKFSEKDLAEFPLELAIIDEFAQYITATELVPRPGDPEKAMKAGDRIAEQVEELAGFAAALNITVMLTTQDPDAGTIPRKFKNNSNARVATRTRSAVQTNAILADGATGAGLRAHDIPQELRGAAIVDIDGADGELIRSCFIEDEHYDGAEPIIAAGYALRAAEGRAPGQFADQVEEWLIRATGETSAAGGPNGSGRPGRPAAAVIAAPILDLLFGAFPEGADRVSMADVRKHLADYDADRWGQGDGEERPAYEARVGKQLAAEIEEALAGTPAALESKQVRMPDGKRPTGYLRADVEAARNAARNNPN
ncbi:hypothetical protein [Streptomyces sp. NPDC002467]|uniref:hypothetical protein n=1 Tax=Streptomyces sp. NPDC002467 TaxID=3364647 RepID=UPI003690D36D